MCLHTLLMALRRPQTASPGTSCPHPQLQPCWAFFLVGALALDPAFYGPVRLGHIRPLARSSVFVPVHLTFPGPPVFIFQSP